MNSTLVVPDFSFHRLLYMLQEEPLKPVFLKVGTHRTPDGIEWLEQAVTTTHPTPAELERDWFFRVVRVPDPAAIPTPTELQNALPSGRMGYLFLGDGDWSSYLWGYAPLGHTFAPLDSVFCPGPSMARFRTVNSRLSLPSPVSEYTKERYSRTRGAMGATTHDRLIARSFAVMGCGNMGSIVADWLARHGVERLSLADDDTLKLANLGQMALVDEADLGLNKAEALARKISALHRRQPIEVRAVLVALCHAKDDAWAAAKAADVIVVCGDNDALVMRAAILAVLYHKVLIVLGAGVSSLEATGLRKSYGCEARIIYPGDGCMLCRGGLVNYAEAVETVAANERPNHRKDWQAERAGSLYWLNQQAVAETFRMMIETEMVLNREMVEGLGDRDRPSAEELLKVSKSRWVRFEWEPGKPVRIIEPLDQADPQRQPGNTPGCELCAIAGLGDCGIEMYEFGR